MIYIVNLVNELNKSDDVIYYFTAFLGRKPTVLTVG